MEILGPTSLFHRIWDRIIIMALITAALIATRLFPVKIPSVRDLDQLLQHSNCHTPGFCPHHVSDMSLDPSEPVDEVFYLKLQEALQSQTLVLLGDFNYPDICQKSSMASYRQSRALLECTDCNFLSRVIDGPIRRGCDTWTYRS